MATYDETMNFKPKIMKWKLSGESDVSSLHNTICWMCSENKLCLSVPVKMVSEDKTINSTLYYCDECNKKRLLKLETATVNVEKANGKP